MDIMERIFYGGLEEFKENGFKFTMDSLAKRIGISKRTLYEQVSSKETLLEVVIDKTFEDIKNQQKEILHDRSMNILEQLEHLLRIVPVYSTYLDFRRVEEMKNYYPRLYQKVQDRLESDWEATTMLISQAMEWGILRKTNVVILKVLLTGIFESLLRGDVLIQNQITYEEAMKECMDIIFQGILMKEERK